MRTSRANPVAVAAISAFVLAGAMAPTIPAAAAGDEPVGGIGLRLTEAPVSAGDDPRARVYIVDHLPPGAVIERQIEVSNTTDSSQRVALYAAAASIDDGTFVGAVGDTPNELSTWTSVGPSEMQIAPGAALAATVTIAVPADAAPGEQYGVIWAEARSDAASAGGVVQVSRVGIRLYVSVGPGGAPAADFAIDSLTASRSAGEGHPVVSASVHNTGGRALDMTGSLLLRNGPGGLTAGPFPVSVGRTLAIDDTRSVDVMLDKRLPAGPWDASITLESGLTEHTVEATLTFPDEGATAPVDTQTSGSPSAWLPLTLASLLALLAAGAIGFIVVRRRRRRRSAPNWPAPWAAPHGHEAPVRATGTV